jgi:DNA-3-methyladenine glycosylase I
MSVTTGADVVRCPWGNDPAMTEYHDTEWGRELRGDHELYERMSLEAFQSGLSWAIILRKRERFREVFAGFDPEVVANFGESDIARLLDDTGIVRNRMKIEATIGNARTILALEGSLSDLLWSFAPPPRPAPTSYADVPATTPESVAMAKALKKQGFRFFGPTTAYALMQATGMVNDDLARRRVAPWNRRLRVLRSGHGQPQNSPFAPSSRRCRAACVRCRRRCRGAHRVHSPGAHRHHDLCRGDRDRRRTSAVQ